MRDWGCQQYEKEKMGLVDRNTSFSEPAYGVLREQALQSGGAQKSRPLPVGPSPVSPALLSALKCLPPCSGCRSSSGARHKGLLVALPRGPPSLRVTHVLAISFVRPAGARGCGRGRGSGAGAPGSRGALSCGQGGSRHARPAHAHSLPEAPWQLERRRGQRACCSLASAGLKAPAPGEACVPQQA